MREYVPRFNAYIINEMAAALSDHYKERISQRLGEGLKIFDKFDIKEDEEILRKYIVKFLADVAYKMVPQLGLNGRGNFGIRTGQIFIKENNELKPILFMTEDSPKPGDAFFFIQKQGVLITVYPINHVLQEQQLIDKIGKHGMQPGEKGRKTPASILYLTPEKKMVIDLDDIKYQLYKDSKKLKTFNKLILDKKESKEMTFPPGKIVKYFNNKGELQEREVSNYEYDKVKKELKIYFTDKYMKTFRIGDMAIVTPQSTSASDVNKLEALVGESKELEGVDLSNLQFKGRVYEIRPYDDKMKRPERVYTMSDGKPTRPKRVPAILIWATEVSW